MYDDTIAAISTAIGEAGIGIVRLSGPDAVPILERIFRPAPRTSPPPGPIPLGEGESHHSSSVTHHSFESHRVYYGHILDPFTGEVIDEVLAFCMRAPRSYTREDVVEIQCHGGPAPLQRVLLGALRAGARLAQPGEFTLRAYLNGRIDLAQAEAVADVIRSRTEQGLSLAMRGLGGQLSQRVRAVRQRLLRALAYLEATIDFAEDDIPEEDVMGPLSICLEEVTGLLATADQGIIYRQGVRVAIVGRPNVGKSSLLNALLGTDRAIVTDVAGTTRDTLEEVANFSGVPVCLVDTAGIAESEDPVERLGVERSRRAMEEADLCLLVVDRSTPLQPEDWEIAGAISGKAAVLVANKADLPAAVSAEDLAALLGKAQVVSTSIPRREGLEAVQEAILAAALSGRATQSDELLVSNPRHKAILMRVESRLRDAIASVAADLPADCTAWDVRSAVDALGEITGESASEELLDTIFSRFCIGK